MNNLQDLRKQIELIFIGFLVFIAILYGLFRAYPLLAGPSITLNTPYDGEVVASTTFEISGTILRAKEITLQGKPITINTAGSFSEILVPEYPYTLIVITATDKYGAKVIKTLKVTPK